MSAFDLYKIGAAHTLYLALAGIAIGALLPVEVTLVEILICGLPTLLALALTFSSTADHEQYVVRLLAAAMFGPILLLFWAGLSTGYSVSLGALHVLCFVGAVMWIGTHTTRVPAARGVPPVDTATLHARLLSLDKIGGPLSVTSPAPEEVTVVFHSPIPERRYRVLLNLDSTKRQVRVRERTSANLAKPSTPAERSMRGPGDPAFDPTRPEATAISETVAQVTPIREADLAAMPSTFQGPSVAMPRDFAAALDERGLATLLCAVVTRSGWHWQPGFFGAK